MVFSVTVLLCGLSDCEISMLVRNSDYRIVFRLRLWSFKSCIDSLRCSGCLVGKGLDTLEPCRNNLPLVMILKA